MQVGGCQVNVHTRTTGRGSKSGRAERRVGESGGAALLHPQKLEALLRVLEPYGIRELVQSGVVSLSRGPRGIGTVK